MSDTELIRYDAMCRAIDAAFEVDEVKDIRDKARAFEVYARQAKNVEAERRACEIRLRAERKAGKLLSSMDKAKRGPDENGQGSQRARSEARSLADLGISYDQSSRWQKLAGVPEEQFEKALAGPDKPTTNGVIAANAPAKQPATSDRALWVWGRLCEFERNGALAADPQQVFGEMTEPMRGDALRLAPLVIAWLERITS